MAHEYKSAARESHDKKLKAYGAEKGDGKAKNWAGFDALNTDEQRGLKPIDKEPELSKGTADRIMRKSGGRIAGANSLKRLDKAPRSNGARKGPVPTAMKAMEATPEKTKHMPEVARRAAGGKMGHDDEAMDRKLVDTMVKPSALTGKNCGGRTGRASGGDVPVPPKRPALLGKEDEIEKLIQKDDAARKTSISPSEYEKGNLGGGEYAMKKGGRAKRADGGILSDSEAPKGAAGKKGKGATTVNILIGGGLPGAGAAPGAGAPPPPPVVMAPPPSAPPGPPPGAMMPPGGAPPMGPPPGAGPGGPPPGLPPMMRADGGKVQVPYKKPGRKDGYPAMDFGSGGGFGRKQKVDAYGAGTTKGKSV